MSAKQEPGAGTGELPKVDFSTFVLSLGTTALFQMGLVPDPETGRPGPPDPLVAQQTIETLVMLREKTLGNLDEEERNLFDSLLYELRIKFVEISR
ncbi:MAG: DUF1844 domain-containing protein [Deltaproteobacteria bacterium]|nr:DUF1844 domain-containing protein [Deltaproteobacteria bacterium]